MTAIIDPVERALSLLVHAARVSPHLRDAVATVEDGIRAMEDEIAHLDGQIDRLARFIIDEVDGEPSQSEGAVDTAIRLLREGLENGSVAEGLGAEIVEPVEDAVARGAIPHDPRENGSDPS